MPGLSSPSFTAQSSAPMPRVTEVEAVVRPLTQADRPAAGEILRLAFADKMPRALGPDPARGAAVLADIVTPCANAFVGDANADGRVAGVLLLEEHGGPSTYVVSWRVLRRRLSIPAALRALLVLMLYEFGSYPHDRLCIDTLAVHPDYQGRGVAGALLRFAIAEGQRRGATALGLYVIDRNAHARAVYEHLGFRRVYTQRLGLLAPLMGFKSADYMELALAVDTPAG